jgi:hypothetical protein
MFDLNMAYRGRSSYLTVGVILPKSGGYDVAVFCPEHSAFFVGRSVSLFVWNVFVGRRHTHATPVS